MHKKTTKLLDSFVFIEVLTSSSQIFVNVLHLLLWSGFSFILSFCEHFQRNETHTSGLSPLYFKHISDFLELELSL